MKDLSPSRSRELLKQTIIDLAIQLFRSTGIKAITMDDIARKMGMSKRTLYQIFTDKEDLLMACVERGREEEEEMRQIVIAQADNMLEVVLYVLGTHMNFLKNVKPSFFKEMQKYPRVVENFRKERRRSREKAIDFLEKGKREGLFRDDVNFGIVYDALTLLVEETLRSPEFKEYEPIEVFENTTLISLRGCATQRGVKIIDEFLASHAIRAIQERKK